MRRIKKQNIRFTVAILACMFALAVSFSAGRRTFAPSLASTFIASNAPTKRVTIAIEGMHCDGCATGIRAMLKRTSGVISAEVSYQRKEAVVDYDPERTTQEKIVEAIKNLGYKASIKNKT